MIYKTIHTILILALCLNSYCQCDNSLTKKAIEIAGDDAVYIRSFNVKLSKLDKLKPLPTAKYSIFLAKGNYYRFTIVNDEESKGLATIQLFRKGKLISSAYDVPNEKGMGIFDYSCEKDGFYNVIISFNNENTGCASGILSVIPKLNTRDEDEEEPQKEKLYMFTDNKLDIIAPNIKGVIIDVNIDNGEILEKEGEYFAQVFEEGEVEIKVEVKDSLGKTFQEGTMLFDVMPYSLPYIVINNKNGGLISKDELLNAKSLELVYPSQDKDYKFEIIEFIIVKDLESYKEYKSLGARINSRQNSFFAGLSSGDTFFIKDIKLLTPEILTKVLEPLEFIVE